MAKKKRNSDDAIVLSKETPLKSAKLFKSLRHPNLINYQNEWLGWDGAAYQSIEADTITADVRQFLGEAKVATYKMVPDPENEGQKTQVEELYPFNPKDAHVKEVYAALKSICHVPMGRMDPPAWLKGTVPEYVGLDPKNLISCQNGLLDITTRTLYPATPCFFTRTALPIDYDANAPQPQMWLDFLDDVLKRRPELIGLVQERTGYLITTDTSLQKVFCLWGRPRSGKSTVLRVTAALVGPRNTCYPTVKTMAGRFWGPSLITASLAQITDMDTENKPELAAAWSNIKSVSGEDGQQIERKGIGDWNGKLDTRFDVACNHLPYFGSHTRAMLERLLVIPFEVSVTGREIRGLSEIMIKTEMPGILNWALDGLDRLRERGDFEEPEQSRSAKRRMRYLSNPHVGFVEEHCELCPADEGVDKDVLYAAYVRYCEAGNHRPKTKADFTETLASDYPMVEAGKRRQRANGDEKAKRPPCYYGIKLNQETARKVYQIEDDDSLGIGLVVFKLDASGWPIPHRYGAVEDMGDDFGA
jgi:putative DNA primase/helicase